MPRTRHDDDMLTTTPTPLEIDIEIVRRSDRIDPVNDRRLQREVAAGRWVPVTAGAYVQRVAWQALTPIERHRLRSRRSHGVSNPAP